MNRFGYKLQQEKPILPIQEKLPWLLPDSQCSETNMSLFHGMNFARETLKNTLGSFDFSNNSDEDGKGELITWAYFLELETDFTDKAINLIVQQNILLNSLVIEVWVISWWKNVRSMRLKAILDKSQQGFKNEKIDSSLVRQ